MKKKFDFSCKLSTACLLLLGCTASTLFGQDNNMGIGTTTPDASSILDIKSNDRGLLIPRLMPNNFPTGTSTGLLFYNMGDKVFNYWDGSWRPVGLWNLNTAGEKAYYSAGFVGIGTNNPTSQLGVEGGLAVGASYADGSPAAPANGAIIEGNVGIGTNNPQSKLDVEGGLTVGASYAGSNAAPANGAIVQGNVGIGTTGPTSKLGVEGGLAVGASYADGSPAAPANGAIIEGNLGIGTNNPTSKLGVDGGLAVGASYAVGSPAAPVNGAIIEGNVGIGTNNPGIKLQVDGGSDVTPGSGGYIMAGSITGTNVTFDNNEIMARSNGSASNLYLNDAGGDVYLCQNGGGNVGIGGDPNGYRLLVRHASAALRIQHESAGGNFWELWQSNVSGDDYRLELWNTNGKVGHFNYNNGNYNGTSDSRLKENVISLGAVLPSVLQLQAKKYTYKSDPNKELNIGFMAQDVEKLFPELVTPPSVTPKGETPYMMFHAGFGMIAIKAIQEQQAVIEAQAAKIEAQQAKLEAIEKALLKAGIKLD